MNHLIFRVLHFWANFYLPVTAVIIVGTGVAVADEIEFSDSATHTTEDLGSLGGLSLKVEKWIEWQNGDYSDARILVHWGMPDGTAGSQELYLGISVGDVKVSRKRNRVSLFIAGNRFASEGSSTQLPFEWNAKSRQFVELPAIEHDPNEDNMLWLQRLLDAKKFVQARSLAAEMGASPNGGHTYQTERMFVMFLKASHEEAMRLYRRGKTAEAAALVHTLFAQPPVCDSRRESEKNQFYLDASQFSTFGENYCFFHIDASPQNTRRINDCAFYLAKGGMHEMAIPLLEQVVHHAPERAVAWLNLADAKWTMHITSAPENYRQYISLMEAANKSDQIPKRARERARGYE